MTLASLIGNVIYFYSLLIIVYVLMSWFPISGVFADIYQVLGTLVEPYLSLFRRVIPPIGALDISPIVAILVLNLLSSLIYRAL